MLDCTDFSHIVYDTTNRRSFDELTRWFEEIRIHVSGPVDKVIVGNKVDKVQFRLGCCDGDRRSPFLFSQDYQRQVPRSEAAAFAKMMGCHFVETSAKTGRGARKAFRNMVERIVDTPELRVVFKPSSPQSSFTRPQDLRFLRNCAATSARPQTAMDDPSETVEAD